MGKIKKEPKKPQKKELGDTKTVVPKKNKGSAKKDKGAEAENGDPKEDASVKLVTIDYLAKATQNSIRTMRDLQRQGVIEPEVKDKGKESLYNFAKCYSALFLYYKEKADSRRSGESKEMTDEKLRQLAAKRELEEMKVQRARGELHHIEDLRHVLGLLFARLHTGFESFPLGIATKLVDKEKVMENAGIIKKGMDKILYEVTDFNFETFKASGGDKYIAELEAEENHDPDSEA